jgi:hypothetical protein
MTSGGGEGAHTARERLQECGTCCIHEKRWVLVYFVHSATVYEYNAS